MHISILWVIHSLHLPLLISASAQFYQALQQAVTQDEVLLTLSDVHTITECVLQCKKHDQCEDVAMQDGDICLLLQKKISNGQPLPSTTRYGLFKESYGKCVGSGKLAVMRHFSYQ